jgi:hypothetical protein
MKLFFERIQSYRDKGKSINCREIKKALLYVLRHNQDLIEYGKDNSSSGSEDAPSDDNLAPEDMEKVVPIEDPKVLSVLNKKKKELQQQEQKAAALDS